MPERRAGLRSGWSRFRLLCLLRGVEHHLDQMRDRLRALLPALRYFRWQSAGKVEWSGCPLDRSAPSCRVAAHVDEDLVVVRNLTDAADVSPSKDPASHVHDHPVSPCDPLKGRPCGASVRCAGSKVCRPARPLGRTNKASATVWPPGPAYPSPGACGLPISAACLRPSMTISCSRPRPNGSLRSGEPGGIIKGAWSSIVIVAFLPGVGVCGRPAQGSARPGGYSRHRLRGAPCARPRAARPSRRRPSRRTLPTRPSSAAAW
jgi:hypothetical protein